MPRQFKGFKSNKNKDITQTNLSEDYKKAQEIMSDYQGKSPQEIKDELFNQYRQRIKSGNISYTQLSQTLQQAKHMFTKEQLQRLEVLLDELKHIK